jgi:hypothetical protein
MKLRRFLCLSAIIAFVFLFSACNAEPVEKRKISSHNIWPEYTFEEACDEAVKIVIGTADSVNRTYVLRLSDSPNSKGEYPEFGYTVLNIKVEKTLKGEHQDIIEYIQEGCETEDRIFIPEGYSLSVGEKALIFIGRNGHMVTYAFLNPIDADGNIVTAYYPEGYTDISSDYKISVDEYAELITDYLAK